MAKIVTPVLESGERIGHIGEVPGLGFHAVRYADLELESGEILPGYRMLTLGLYDTLETAELAVKLGEAF